MPMVGCRYVNRENPENFRNASTDRCGFGLAYGGLQLFDSQPQGSRIALGVTRRRATCFQSGPNLRIGDPAEILQQPSNIFCGDVVCHGGLVLAVEAPLQFAACGYCLEEFWSLLRVSLT